MDSLFAPFDHPDQPGVAVSVLYRGEVVYERAFGQADLAAKTPLTPTTPLYAAALSGQFTAVATLLLVADGSIALDDPVRKHLPELAAYGDGLRLQHLLHRTSGLAHPADLLAIQGAVPGQALEIESVLHLLAAQPAPVFSPGTDFSDGDVGLVLLAEIVARVSGKTFGEFCATRIFTPLGLTSAWVRGAGVALRAGTAKSYRNDEGVFSANPLTTGAPGAEGLYISVQDWRRWEQFLQSPSQDWKPIIEQLHQPARQDNGKQHNALYGELLVGQQFDHLERGA
ncbi:MAG: serine hydrolase domain-containing protein, partial [Bacteroidota bacterium]